VLRSAVPAATAHPSDVVGEGGRAGERSPVPRFAVTTPTRQTASAIEAMALYAGQSVGAVTARQPAAEIVGELAEGRGPLAPALGPRPGRARPADRAAPPRRRLDKVHLARRRAPVEDLARRVASPPAQRE
jgi:hypothetical protein